MESNPLVGAYQRYKAGTEKLIQWLFDSVNTCDRVAPSRQPKGKLRTGVVRKVRTDELILLAEKIISATDPTIDIPLGILDCTRDTIKGRQQSALWYADKGDIQSNSTHRYFLTTLEEIFELLKREVKSRRPKRKKKIELATDSKDLGNVFLHLELEDSSIGDETDTPVKAKKTPTFKQPVALEMSEEDLDNEKRFAIWCLMDDLHSIRAHMRGIWKQYKDGELSLQTTCEITDRAVHIMCLVRDDFLSDHPTLASWTQILHCIGIDRYVRNARDITPWVCSSERHEHERPSTTCHSERLCMPAWCALQSYTQLVHWIKYVRPTSDAGDRPVFAFTSHPFAKALLNITADLVKLASQDSTTHEVFDRYTGFLLLMAHKDETYGPHTLVATQMYMEIWDVLEGHTERAMLEADVTISQAMEATAKFDAFSKACNSQDNGRSIQMDVTGGSGARPCRKCKIRQTRGGRSGWVYQAAAGESALFIPSKVLAALPIFCGVAAFREQVDLTIHGSRLCNANQFTLAAAHLYRAATAQGSLEAKWDDMEFLIARQNTRASFVRDVEGQENVDFVAKQYCLALGIPLTQVAGKYRPPIPSDNTCAKRANHMRITSAWLLAEWSDNRGITPFQFFYECARSYMAYHKVDDDLLVSQWELTKKLTPCQLLTIVGELLHEDEPYVNFDLYRFAQRCIDLTMKCCDIFLQRHSSPRIGNRRPMPYVITAEILWTSASVLARGLDKSKSSLHAAAQTMQDLIRLHGREGVDQAIPLSSGNIPEDDKPAVRYRNALEGPRDSASFPGLLDVEYEPIFESAYVASATEAEILENALEDTSELWKDCPLQDYSDHDRLDFIALLISSMANMQLKQAGIDRFAHVTIGQDLTPLVRSIALDEYFTYVHQDSVKMLQRGVFIFNAGCPVDRKMCL